MNGRQSAIYVSRAVPVRGGFKFNVSNKFESLLTIGVVQRSPSQFEFYQLTPSTISKFGSKKGPQIELIVADRKDSLVAKTENLPRIESLASLRRETSSKIGIRADVSDAE
jgi:hypothetical protein